MDKQKESVIHSFGTYALGDIRHNLEKPIAAFILGAVLIDNLGVYRYGYSNGFYDFCKEYLPMYDAAKLTGSLKYRLLPFYSLQGGRYKIGWGDRDKEENKQFGVIHVEDFIKNLENAFAKFVSDLNEGVFDIEDVFLEHPIIADKSNEKLN